MAGTQTFGHDGEETKVVQTRVKAAAAYSASCRSLGFVGTAGAGQRDFMLVDDLELTRKDANWQLFKDFSYWFWNH